VLLEALNDILKNSEEDIRANFSVGSGGGCATLMKERKEVGPSTLWELNACDGGDYTRRRMADKVTIEWGEQEF
jgi:hypothetical protein